MARPRMRAGNGTTENALKKQIWIAITVHVPVAIVKKTAEAGASIYTLLRILSVTLFEKTPILQVLTDLDYETQMTDSGKQLVSVR